MDILKSAKGFDDYRYFEIVNADISWTLLFTSSGKQCLPRSDEINSKVHIGISNYTTARKFSDIFLIVRIKLNLHYLSYKIEEK